jgi:hypothetical protein
MYGADPEPPPSTPFPDASAPESGADVDTSGDASTVPDAEGSDASDAAVGPAALSDACLFPSTLPMGTATHLIAIYEGGGAVQANGSRLVTVNVAGTKPVTLVLSSYEKVTWKIVLGSGASVAKVDLHGFVAGTTITGIPPTVPVTTRASSFLGTGYKRTSGSSVNYGKAIAAVRAGLGHVETTAQFLYTGVTFSVGGTNAAPAPPAGYDTRKACVSPCAVTPSALAWKTISPQHSISADGLTVVLGGIGLVQMTRGLRCGKHYFEIEAYGSGELTINGVDDYSLPAADPGPALESTTKRIGVALDLDVGEVTYSKPTDAGAPQKTTYKIDRWYFDEVGPTIWPSGSGKATLVIRSPFQYVPPAGFVADY